MQQIQKSKPELTAGTIKYFSENHPKRLETYDRINTGDIIIKNRYSNGIYKVVKIEYDPEKYPTSVVYLCTEYDGKDFIMRNVRYTTTDRQIVEKEEFHRFSIEDISVSQVYSYVEFLEFYEKAEKIFSGEDSLEMYKTENTFDNANAIVGRFSKELLEVNAKQLEKRKYELDSINSFLAIAIEKKKNQLENLTRNLKAQSEALQKQVGEIQKVVVTIELYLGVDEELVQLRVGLPTDAPISFRQQVIYMDEEVGAWENDGLDFSDIDKFDEWLLKDDKFKTMIPEEKGMIAFKPRRTDKDYGNVWLNAHYNFYNKVSTYFLIRNGENLYRLFTDRMILRDKMFPNSDELAKFFDLKDKSEEDKNDFAWTYKKQALFIQGLINRTAVFHPMKADFSVFDLDKITNDVVRFVYDADEHLIAGPRPLWSDFLKAMPPLSHGDRICLYRTMSSDDAYERYLGYKMENRYRKPERGLYDLESYTPELVLDQTEEEAENYLAKFADLPEEDPKKPTLISKGARTYWGRFKYKYKFKGAAKLSIMYNPQNTVWTRDWNNHERKTRVRLFIWESDVLDNICINFDLITEEDCKYYLHSRQDRRNYLRIMPALHFIMQEKRYEESVEAEFRKMVQSCEPSATEEAIKYCVRWWKLKNKIKRPIAKDDALALRMIRKKLKSDFLK